jgi:anti-sigma B factor antagonist
MQEVIIQGLEEGALKVQLSGDIDLGNAEEFYNLVSDAYAQTPADLHFDCAQLNFIDSTPLGTFVKILKKAKTDGHTVRLIALQPKIKKLFLICALDSIMEIE